VGVLDRFERRLDRLVSGAFARAFKADVQPVEIARALQRECDDKAAIVARGRTIVPNVFTVELGDRDHERLAGYAAPLSDELAGLVREHAGEQGYAFVGPIEVDLDLDPSLDTGVFRVRSEAVPGELPAEPVAGAPCLEINGIRHTIPHDQCLVGRGSDATIRIDDPSVSRRHAMIRLVPGPRVVDLGSTNGTFVDGQRISEADLVDGSGLSFAKTPAVFRTGG
jgi:hypothetical protein